MREPSVSSASATSVAAEIACAWTFSARAKRSERLDQALDRSVNTSVR